MLIKTSYSQSDIMEFLEKLEPYNVWHLYLMCDLKLVIHCLVLISSL